MSITRKLFVSAALLTLSHIETGYSINPNTPAPTSAVAMQSSDFSQEEIQRLSEAFGNFIGRNLKTPAVQFDLESMIRGIRNGAAGKPSPMTDQEYEQAMARLQQVAFKRLSEENLQAANTFMNQNAKKPNVVQLEPNKLQYLVTQPGTGAAVQEHSTPQIRYKGSFIDGSVFSNSNDVGGPISVPLDQTVPGFRKGLVGMKEGEKRTLYVHPDLGYGTTGQLPPNALLIFEIELVKADAQPKSTAPSAAVPSKAPSFKPVTIDEEDEDDDDFAYADDDIADDEEFDTDEDDADLADSEYEENEDDDMSDLYNSRS